MYAAVLTELLNDNLPATNDIDTLGKTGGGHPSSLQVINNVTSRLFLSGHNRDTRLFRNHILLIEMSYEHHLGRIGGVCGETR